MAEVDSFFDEMRRLLGALGRGGLDNEASRHDRLIYPFLTHPLTLGWRKEDVLSQPRALLPSALYESHIFRSASVLDRRPDLLFLPPEIGKPVLVVEEKRKQATLDALNEYRHQLLEYQSLFECVWGILTDGNQWIIKKGFETYHKFGSIDELERGLRDLQHAIGRGSVLQRYSKFGTIDLVLYVPSRDLSTPPYYDQEQIRRLYDQSEVTVELLRSIAALRSHAPFKDYGRIPWTYQIEGDGSRTDAQCILDVISVFPTLVGMHLASDGLQQNIWVHDVEGRPYGTYQLVCRIVDTFRAVAKFGVYTGI